MSSLTLSARGRAEPGEVWERYARPARWSGWSPQVQRVDCSAERIAAGVTGTVRSWVGPGVTFIVDEVDEQARTWTWRVALGPIRLALGHGVEAAPNGTRTWLRVSGPLPVVLAYAPLARAALQRLVRP